MPSVPVQAEEVLLRWVEFCEDSDAPASLAHDGLDETGDLAQGLEGFGFSWSRLLMLVLRYQRILLLHCDSTTDKTRIWKPVGRD